MDKINLRVKKIRKHFKHLQSDMANFFDYKLDTYSKKERHGNFTVQELMMLADYFGIDIRYFLYDNIENSQQEKPIIPKFGELSRREKDIIIMYSFLPKAKKQEVFAYIFNAFNEKKGNLKQ